MQMRMKRQNPWHIVKSARSKDIKHMNARPKSQRHLNLKDIATTVKNMDIDHLNAYPSLHGDKTR